MVDAEQRPAVAHGLLSWSRFIGQFGGVAKLGSDCRHAASFIVPCCLVCLVGRAPGQRRMRAVGVVVGDPRGQSGTQVVPVLNACK